MVGFLRLLRDALSYLLIESIKLCLINLFLVSFLKHNILMLSSLHNLFFLCCQIYSIQILLLHYLLFSLYLVYSFYFAPLLINTSSVTCVTLSLSAS